MQLRIRHIARNIFSNWVSTGANMVVGLFLAPFIVHHLGNVAYGVWVLAISSVNYMGMLDLGMRTSVVRWVSRCHTIGDHAGSTDALSAAFWVRLQISGLVVVLSTVLAIVFPHLFRVPPEMATTARIAVMLIGLNMVISMSVGAIGGVLSALNRYDLQSIVALVQLTIRVTGVVYVLRSGHGIVAIALCEIASSIVANALTIYFVRRIYPEVRVHLKKPERTLLRSLWSYSFYAFLNTLALQLIYQSDNLLVGTMISAAAVTIYSIGNALCRYADQLLTSMSLTFVPAASTYEASGNLRSLQNLYYNGSRATLMIALPILLTFLTRGDQFIGVWMGASYAHSSGLVLIILSIPLPFVYANRTAVSIAFGTEKHKKPAIWAVMEGAANLTLSALLIKPFGIYGVAIGTLIPSLFFQLIVFPNYLSELLHVSAMRAITRAWGPVFLAAVPFGLASWMLREYPAAHLLGFFAQTAAILPLFFIALALIFHRKVTSDILPLVSSQLNKRLRGQIS